MAMNGLEMEFDAMEVDPVVPEEQKDDIRFWNLLERIQNSDPKLRYLDIDNAELIEFLFLHVPQVLKAMSMNTSIEDVYVKVDKPDDETPEVVVLQHCNFWSALSIGMGSLRALRTVRIRGDDVLVASLILVRARQITAFRMISQNETLNKGESEVLLLALADHPSLESITVGAFSRAIFGAFLEALPTLPKLRSLTMANLVEQHQRLGSTEQYVTLLRDLPNLRELELSRFLIEAEDTPALVHYLAHHESLEMLRLVDCHIAGDGLICQALAQNTRLLDFVYSCPAEAPFYASLASAMRVNQTLKRLHLKHMRGRASHSGMEWLLLDLLSNHTLESLVLVNYTFDQVVSTAVHDYLRASPALRRIRLYSKQGLTDDSLCIIYPALASNSTLLTFEVFGDLTPRICGQVVASLETNTTLQELSIVNNNDPRSADTLIHCLANLGQNKTLQLLRVGFPRARLSVDESRIVLNMMQANYTLTKCPITVCANEDENAQDEMRFRAGIDALLKLNRYGRRYLVEGRFKESGVALLASVANDLNCVSMHIMENPLLIAC